MKTFSRIIPLLLAWGLALFAALQLGNVPVDWGHVCGPWGCGPPVKALVAWHGFWGILLALPVLLAIAYWPGRRLQRVGLVLTAAGLLGLAGIAVWQTVDWLPRVSDSYQRYFAARYLFVVATLVDVPIVQLTLAGIACWCTGTLRARSKRRFTHNGFVPGD